ncbi:hypothetical protein PILCRDRAFT_218764 [Piloderma croceum F 1598]|uniref:Pet127-domain-containing protein n=1 Tax=Piloderma croceum (strain F 1598) TaxID=765440 RepID=A0A0C3GF36_PILCF|nr:hypothetical protein PILCRDRAFT_218764 [Piloderma croceum F 1598]
MSMNLIHYAKPRLLLSCPYPAGKIISFAAAKPWQNRPRTFTALAESDSAPGAELIVATQAIPPSVHSDSRLVTKKNHGRVAIALHVSKNIQSFPLARPQKLSDKLRLRRATEKKKNKTKEHAEISSAISAAEDAISRNHASQEDIINSLHGAIVSDKKSKRGKKRAHEKKKKPANVDISALFKTFTASKAPEHRRIKLNEEGWKADEWQSHGWGKDALVPLTSELGHVPKMPRVRLSQGSPLPYTRRIEGLLQHTEQAALEDLAPPCEQKPVAKLAHGLDRVLFNPGVHWLQDPRSGVYNFTTWLESIPNVRDFAFDRVTGFIKSSSDEDLWTLAKQERRRYTGSTSSLTGMLNHIYFLLSGFREVDTSSLSRHFQYESKSFTAGQRSPVSVKINYRDGIYAFDSDSSDLADMNVLMWMGTMLEKFLTMPRDEFKRYLLDAPELTEEEIDTRREAYRYSKSEQFVMRSQLDGIDSRLPGTGVFDIKTRAAVPIRQDLMNYAENSGYLIKTLQGPVESFEKEYYDLIRSAFLKYSFQVRIGNMDGVIVAYHNTARLFGFQYIPLDEMDTCLFGSKSRGDRVFQKCVGLLEQVADEIIGVFPEQSIQCTFETNEKSGSHVWVEPSEWDAEKGPCPIVQLDVNVTNYLNETEVGGSRAVSAIELPWVVHWSISRSSLSDENIRYNLSEAKNRQFQVWSLPTGVGYEQMEKHWQTLKIRSTSKSEYKSGHFRHPSKNVERLRALARSGREETHRLSTENAGKSKVVWGVPEDVENSDMEVQEYMEEDTVAISTDDSPPAVIVENPAGSELEQALEGIELGSTVHETDMWSDDIETVLDDVVGSQDEHLGLDAGATIGPHLEAAEGGISGESPAVAPELPDINASDVAPRPSTSLAQSREDIRSELSDEPPTEEHGVSEIAGNSTVATILTPNSVLEAPPIISNQASQTRHSISESEDRAPEEGIEKDNVAAP